MNKLQVYVLWVVALVVSALLVYLGLIKPHRASLEYDEGLETHMDIVKKVTDRLKDPAHTPSEVEIQLLDTISDNIKEIAEEKSRDRGVVPNYYVGLVAPIVILGFAAFVTAGYRRRQVTN